MNSSVALARERRSVVGAALTTALAPLNSTMIAVALPSVMRDFDVSLAATGWLVTGYLIAMASLQPVAGKLGDRYGRRPLLLAGLAYFAVASLGAALAPSFAWLLAFRLQQAIAGAIALPNVVAIVRQIVPAQRLGGRLGLIAGATSLAAAVGPVLAGLLVWLGGWQAIFYVNLLIIAPAWWLQRQTGVDAQPRPPSHVADEPMRRRPFDLLGSVLLAVALIGVAVWLAGGREQGAGLHGAPWAGNARVWVAGGAVLLGIVVFYLRHEWRHADPIVQPRFFTHRSFAAATGGVAASNLTMYVTLLTVPLLLAARGWDSARSGAVLMVMSGAMFVFSPVGGWWADRRGRRTPPLAGFVCLAVGALGLAFAGGRVDLWLLLGALALIGAGVGLASAGLQASALESVDADDAGAASGVYSTSRYLGSIVGSAMMGALLDAAGAGAAAVSTVFIMIAVSALIAVAAAAWVQDRPVAS